MISSGPPGASHSQQEFHMHPWHTRPCNSAETSLPWKVLRTYFESCASILQAVVCRPLLPLLLLSLPTPSPNTVRSRNPSKFMLSHDAVTAAVSQKHHSIICVGAGLIQFVYGSHLRLATELIDQRILFLPWFSRAFLQVTVSVRCKHTYIGQPVSL